MSDEENKNEVGGIAADRLRSLIERIAVSYTHLTLPTIGG